MAQSTVSVAKTALNINVARDSAFTDKLFNATLSLSQTSEESHYQQFHVDGQVTDQAIPFGNVTSPVLLFVKFVSKKDGTGGTTDNDPSTVTVKVNSGTAFECKYLLLAVDVDSNADEITNTVTFSTEANSDTTVEVLAVGAST